MTHRRDYRAEERRRGSRHERGYGALWTKLVEQVKREEPLCRPCKACGRVTPAAEVDHIKPKAQGGTDDRENLQGICSSCHAAKTAQEQGAPARHGCDAAGMPADPHHEWNRRD